MDTLVILRTLGSLGLVLGLLAGGLWLLRRVKLRLPGVAGAGKRLELVERTPIDGKRSAVLIRRDGREHLLLVGPEGTTVVESAILTDALDRDAADQRAAHAQAEQVAAEQAMREARERLERAAATAAHRVQQLRNRLKPLVGRLKQSLAGGHTMLRSRGASAAGKTFRAHLARQLRTAQGQLPARSARPARKRKRRPKRFAKERRTG